MKLRELLTLAVKSRASELSVAVNGPLEIKVDGVLRRINLPPMAQEYFDELVVQELSPEAREALRTNGRCEDTVTFEGLGQFRIEAEKSKTRIVLPPPQPKAQSGLAPGQVPTLMDRLRNLFR